MKLVIGSDHAGFELRNSIAHHLESQGHTMQIVGATSTDSYDYPAASDAVAQAILNKDAELGILICGSGIGVMIRANRYPGIRAANCCSKEMVTLSRQHNHANVLCLGARLLDTATSLECVDTFLNTPTDTSVRHTHRVKMLDSTTNC